MLYDTVVDVTGESCPAALIKTKLELSKLKTGHIVRVIATDRGLYRDLPKYLNVSPHELVSHCISGLEYEFIIKTGCNACPAK